MLFPTFSYDNVCKLIISVLNSSFNINSKKLCDVSDFNNCIDSEFRKMIWPNFDSRLMELSKLKKETLYALKSSMQFTTLLYAFPKDMANDVIIIGPFLETEPDDKFLSNLLKEHLIPSNIKHAFSTYYNSLPVANPFNVITTINHLLQFFINDYDSSSVCYIDFSKDKSIAADYDHRDRDDQKFFMEYHKKYKSCLEDIFKHIRLGKDATPMLNEYMELTGLLRCNSIEKMKNILYILNTHFESELLKEQSFAAQIGQLSLKNQIEIETETSKSKLLKLPYRMLKKYSNLISNVNLQEYSYTVRTSIEYIHLNLQLDLTLSSIANHLQKNPNYLSTQFKKETGKTITRYIQEKRIEEAMHMLDNTNMSIQEIAHTVGIEDVSWFSKLFKSIANTSPTAYRENLRNICK